MLLFKSPREALLATHATSGPELGQPPLRDLWCRSLTWPTLAAVQAGSQGNRVRSAAPRFHPDQGTWGRLVEFGYFRRTGNTLARSNRRKHQRILIGATMANRSTLLPGLACIALSLPPRASKRSIN